MQTARKTFQGCLALLRESGIQPGPEWTAAYRADRVRELEREIALLQAENEELKRRLQGSDT